VKCTSGVASSVFVWQFVKFNSLSSVTQNMANDVISLFMKIGLTEQRAKETTKNEVLSQTLKEVIIQVQSQKNGLQMIRAKYDSRKLTGRFAQDDSRNRG